jgi:glycosyltransferase involved in cell wall biosynthesis
LSLFQIDTEVETSDSLKPSFFVAKELKRRGYPFQYVVRQGSPLYARASAEGLPVLPLKLRGHRSASSILRLYLAMKKRRCQLVDVHNIGSMALGFAAASLAKVPLKVFSRREGITAGSEDVPYRRYSRQIDAIAVASEEMRESLVGRGIDQRLIRIIPQGIDFSPYTMEAPKDFLRKQFSFSRNDFLAGMVIHPADEKGLRDLIQVAKYLKELAPKIKLIILGEGRMEFEQGPQMKVIGGEELFMYIGFREHIPQIIHSLNVFALSSDQIRISPVLLDTMACCIPVIVTKSGGIDKMIADGKTGLVVPFGRPKSIVKAMIKVLKDRTLANQMGQRGQDFACRKFSAETMASRVVDFYEDLAQKKRVRFKRII